MLRIQLIGRKSRIETTPIFSGIGQKEAPNSRGNFKKKNQQKRCKGPSLNKSQNCYKKLIGKISRPGARSPLMLGKWNRALNYNEGSYYTDHHKGPWGVQRKMNDIHKESCWWNLHPKGFSRKESNSWNEDSCLEWRKRIHVSDC